LLTGRYAFRSEDAAHGVWGFAKPVIEPERETLASLLKKSGYHTACIGKWHLGVGWQTKDGNEPQFNAKTGYSNVDFSKKITGGPNDYGFDYSFIHPASLDIPPYLFLRNHEAVDADMILTTGHYPARKENTEFSWDKKHSNDEAVYWEKGVWWRQGEMSRSFRVEDCHTEIVNEGVAFIEKQATKTRKTVLSLPAVNRAAHSLDALRAIQRKIRLPGFTAILYLILTMRLHKLKKHWFETELLKIPC
jgi:arylsulfatase A